MKPPIKYDDSTIIPGEEQFEFHGRTICISHKMMDRMLNPKISWWKRLIVFLARKQRL